jgi:hypothetical protein
MPIDAELFLRDAEGLDKGLPGCDIGSEFDARDLAEEVHAYASGGGLGHDARGRYKDDEEIWRPVKVSHV